MADALEQLIRQGERWLRKRARERRRPSVKKKRKLAYQFLLLILLSAIGTWLYFLLHTDRTRMRWGFALAGLIASCVGVIFSIIAAWRSGVAEERTQYLLDRLEETQRIVSQSPTAYEDVFNLHVLRPMQRGIDPLDRDHHLDRLDMHISTPAYGYHVLGLDKHLEFRTLISTLQCQKQIILFSPDAHFFHVANTLLWHPLKPLNPNEFVAISNSTLPMPKHDKKVLSPEILARCIMDTMDVLRVQVHQAEQESDGKSFSDHKDFKVAVWTSNTTEFRLTAFRFETDSQAFLLLTDQVTLASDLEHFRGRALALPAAIHRQVIGDPGDRQSFFEQLKTCPYSGETHEQARLRSKEFYLLNWDYLFLRTGHAVIDLHLFNIQCRQVIWAKEQHDQNKQLGVAREILVGLAQYFMFMESQPKAAQYAPVGSVQEMRLSKTQAVTAALRNAQTTEEEVLQILCADPLHKDDPFKTELREFETHMANHEAHFISLSKWISCIYYFVSSGFHQSLFATARRERAPYLKPSPAIQTEEQPVLPIEAIEDGPDSLVMDNASVTVPPLALGVKPQPTSELSENSQAERTTTDEDQASNVKGGEEDSDDKSDVLDK